MVVSYLPFTLFPTPFKRAYYEQVFNLQPDINNLIYKIANSPDVIERNFKKYINNIINTQFKLDN